MHAGINQLDLGLCCVCIFCYSVSFSLINNSSDNIYPNEPKQELNAATFQLVFIVRVLSNCRSTQAKLESNCQTLLMENSVIIHSGAIMHCNVATTTQLLYYVNSSNLMVHFRKTLRKCCYEFCHEIKRKNTKQ